MSGMPTPSRAAAVATQAALAALCWPGQPQLGLQPGRARPGSPVRLSRVPSSRYRVPSATDAGPPVTAGRCRAWPGRRSLRPHGYHARLPVAETPRPALRRRRRPCRMTTRRVCAPGASQPCLEGVHHRDPVGEDVRVVPLGVEEHGHVRPVGIEVAGVLVGLHDEGISPPPARRGGQAAGEPGRQQRTDEGRRVAPGSRPAGAPASLPTWTCRACRRPPRAARPGWPRHPPRPAARVRWHAGRPGCHQLGVVGMDRRQGLGHGQPRRWWVRPR